MTAPARLRLAVACGLAAAGLGLAALAAGVAPGPQSPVPAASPAPALVPATPAATLAQANKPSVSTRAPIRPAQVRIAPAPRPEATPTWAELTPQQQQSLAPLTGTWRVLSE